jgi:hypothetical protein
VAFAGQWGMAFFSRFFARRQPDGAAAGSTLDKELANWRIVEANNEAAGDHAVFRIRMTKPVRRDIDSLATAVVIKWPYHGRVRPPAEVNQQQLAFEGAIDRLSSEGGSELMQVATGMSLKEWIFYARNSDAFMARLNDLLSGHPRYPIEVEFYDDPEWQMWSKTVSRLKAHGA